MVIFWESNMYDPSSSATWFGELRTSAGSIIVVYDRQIPQSSSGRIYLYNTERGSMIEYVEEIVKKNLFDLSDEELKAAKKKYTKHWKAEKDKVLSRLNNRLKVVGPKPAAVNKNSDDADIEDEEGMDEDDMEFNSLFSWWYLIANIVPRVTSANITRF